MLGAIDRLHMSHRCWRYRFKSEVPSVKLVRRANFSGATVIDVGANRGVYSIYLSRATGPRGRVIAFEPQPELGRFLESVKQSFELDNVTIVNAGLSSRPGTRLLRRSKPGSGGATLEPGPTAAAQELAVPVLRLDDYLEHNAIERVDFIKCDVEGHESEVFEGARSTLERCLPVLLFECHHDVARAGTLFDFLRRLGYDGYFFHVSREDHESIARRGHGRYVHYSEFARYEYVRPGLALRNYVFLPQGAHPEHL